MSLTSDNIRRKAVCTENLTGRIEVRSGRFGPGGIRWHAVCTDNLEGWDDKDRVRSHTRQFRQHTMADCLQNNPATQLRIQFVTNTAQDITFKSKYRDTSYKGTKLSPRHRNPSYNPIIADNGCNQRITLVCAPLPIYYQ